MKTGDKIICIDNNANSKALTINKQYKVLEEGKFNKTSNDWILVKCDDGSFQHFSKKRFINLREYNLNKLKI